MRARLTVLAGAAAAVGAVAARVLRRRRRAEAPDPRADELRQRLEESRAVVAEREEFEAAETPVDEAAPVPDAPEQPHGDAAERRREIHERARSAAEEMRGD